jgi:hypothetical protein
MKLIFQNVCNQNSIAFTSYSVNKRNALTESQKKLTLKNVYGLKYFLLLSIFDSRVNRYKQVY